MWYEDLPDGCPPSDATLPDGGRTFYRLVSTIPPNEEDFVPIGRENSARNFGRLLCRSLSLSVLDRLDSCKELLKLPSQRGKLIVGLDLDARAGPIKRTANTPGHYSWWRRADFDASAAAKEVAYA